MKPTLRRAGLAAALLLVAAAARAQSIPVTENLWRLAPQEDTDGDHRITIHDRVTPFELRDGAGAAILTLTNVSTLSVLLQELKRADDEHRAAIDLTQLRLNENIVDRTHRLIREYDWDALTRRIDADHLEQVVHDDKVVSKDDYIYVPGSDETAVRYFRALERDAAKRGRFPELKVVVLPPPEKINASFLEALDGAHGILSLKLETDSRGRPVRGTPYVVPGGRFNELYYWDSYFIVLGLLQDGRRDLARGMADNLLYSVQHYGKVPNANRTYYLTRSQPPFLTSMIRAVYESGAVDKKWLADALATAAVEYRNVWLGPDRLVSIGPYRLSRYYDAGSGPCPEVEPGHYDDKITPWLELVNRDHASEPPTPFEFLGRYRFCREYANLEAGGLTLAGFFKNDRAERESGHDTTHRFDDRAAEFVTVDLNALLYRYEMDFAELIESEFGGRLDGLGNEYADAAFWRRQAAARKTAMIDLMWDDAHGYFFDYDFVNHRRSSYISATGLYPLWAGIIDRADPRERDWPRRIAAFVHANLEEPAGLTASAAQSVASARRHDVRQWDYPYGWPPHQMLAWQGFHNYGLEDDAERLAYRWLYTIAKNARDFNGTIPEKMNVVTGSHEVFAEYGNVGTKFAYITPEGFGWVNASFEVGPRFLSAALQSELRELKALKMAPPLPEDSANRSGWNP